MNIILILGITFIILYCCGIEPFVVESGSMEPNIKTGSLSFINKHVKYDDIKVNDIIAFSVETGNKVTHRVVNITDEGLETKGDANNLSDGISTTRKNYIGKNIFSIPKVGYGVKIIQTTKGRVILITFIVVILLSGFLLGEKKKGKHDLEEPN
jgi:signal peptidase